MKHPIDKATIEDVLEKNLERQLHAASEAFAIAMRSYRNPGTFRFANIRESLSRTTAACVAAMGIAATLGALEKINGPKGSKNADGLAEVEALADLFSNAGRPKGGGS